MTKLKPTEPAEKINNFFIKNYIVKNDFGSEKKKPLRQ